MQKYNDKKNILEDMNVFFGGNNLFKIKDLKTDIIEEIDKYLISIEIPGVEKDYISITFSDGYLCVNVNKKEIKEEKVNYIKRERVCSSITRKYYLPNIDEDEIKAKLENGVLNIICSKSEEEPNKNIKIE
jgi:HSP20 family protein